MNCEIPRVCTDKCRADQSANAGVATIDRRHPANHSLETVERVMHTSGVYKMPSISAKHLLMLGLAWCAMIPTAGIAQTIKFSTADGKFEVSGKIVGFIRDGERIAVPKAISRDLSILIEKEDGALTPPVPVRTLSEATLRTISNVFLKKQSKKSVDTDTEAFRNHFADLANLYNDYKREAGGARIENKELRSRIRNLRRKVGAAGRGDGIFDFVLSFIECGLGDDRSGKLLSIAKDHDGHFDAWKAAVTMTLHYNGASKASVVLTRFKDHIITFCEEKLDPPQNQESASDLDRAAKAAAWLLTTCEEFQASGASNSDNPSKILADQSLLNVLAKLETFGERKEDANQKRFAANALQEAEKERQLESLASEADGKLTDWQLQADKIWNSGVTAFNVQKKQYDSSYIASVGAHRQHDLAYRKKQEAESELRQAESQLDAAEEPDDIKKAQSEVTKASAKHATWEAEEAIAREKCRQFDAILYNEEQKLRFLFQQLAAFVNNSKNMAIMFESNYLEAFKSDESLKAKWIDFTDRLKLMIRQFPAMPTIRVPQNSRKETLAEKENELYKKIEFNLDAFFTELSGR